MSQPTFSISHCPTCGSPAIRRVRGTWKGSFAGSSYVVKGLEYFSCPSCGEKVYPPEAMRKIQAESPAYQRSEVA